VSIVILNWHSKAYCLACLESLAGSGWLGERSEVIVIDNGSHDGALEDIGERFPEVRTIANERNLGIGGGREQGAALARGDAVLFLDVDTVVRPGAIEALLGTLSVADVGIVGPRLVDAEGNLQLTCRLFPTLQGKVGRRMGWGLLTNWTAEEELAGWDHESERDVDYVIGACQLVRRAVLETVGPHDRHFFYGPDDVDLCLRARYAGWRVVYQPQAFIHHAERRVTRRRGISRLMLMHGTLLAYYFAKHRYLFSRRRLYRRIERGPRRGHPEAVEALAQWDH
jgi:N-acetylglucosaminyl-diphospho-decaprenol L-rhamnosyltransferase